jgi:biopolymer transport protein ExbB/biopolymer transport protein TolQ
MRYHATHGKRVAGFVLAAVLLGAVSLWAQTAPEPAAKAQESAFKLQEMLARGWPIISILMIMSIVSLAVVTERLIIVKRAERDAEGFLPEVLKAVKEGKPAPAIVEICEGAGHPLGGIVATVLGELGDREAMERAAQRALQLKIDKLERRTPVLGTIASTAPFVGLLGTVIGIIKAFQSIAVSKGGGPEVVAGGVAEALITTAFGLFVAIPAVIGYNHLVHRVQRLALEVQVNVSEIIDRISKRK